MAVFYTKDHDWISVDGDVATVGITNYAQAQLGDILYVEVPVLGAALERGREAAVLESIKTASDIFSPLTGIVTEANGALEREPSLVNLSPESLGWLFRMAFADPSELDGLLTKRAYGERVKRL